jgi:CheY-like chemotaxis protein
VNNLRDCVLVAEDNFIIVHTYVIELRPMGLTVCGTANTSGKAIALATQNRPRLVLADHRLKGQDDGATAAIAIHGGVRSKIFFITMAARSQDFGALCATRPTCFSNRSTTVAADS